MDFDTASQSLSPGAAITIPELRLPATCEPPSESNPPAQAVWVVCASGVTRLAAADRATFRSLEQPATSDAHLFVPFWPMVISAPLLDGLMRTRLSRCRNGKMSVV
jgi:rhodanese-related sulfurtransferase